ncbi:MAG: phosphotransferase [Caldilineaceae bacterium]
MNAPFFPVQRSVLQTAALTDRVLSNYTLDAPITCQLYHRGMNDTYLVTADDFQGMLRISLGGWRTQAHIEAEITLLQWLGEHGFTTPQPIRRQDGAYLQSLHAPEGERYAVLFTFVDGEPSADLDPEQSRCYGQLVARLHCATDEIPPLARFHHDTEHLIDQSLRHFRPYFAHAPEATDFLTTVREQLRTVVEQLPQTAPIYGLCHGDLRAEHIYFRDEGAPSLIDFDEAGYGWRIYDISTFIWPLVFPGNSDADGALRNAFLAGYQTVRPLSTAELTALPYFVLLRHLWAAGTAARYFPLDLGVKHINPLLEPALWFMQQWLAEIDSQPQ